MLQMGLLKVLIVPIILSVGAYFAYTTLNPPKADFPKDGWFGTGPKRADDTKINSFQVKVPQGIIEDLKSRLKQSRINHDVLEDSDNFQYGFNVNYLKKVKDYWLTKYDWTKQEAILNSWPQFTTEIEGLKTHFYHIKPDAKKYKKVLPLLIVHGWPGNVFEFYKILPMLVDPAAFKIGGTDFAFEIIAPSIPGYGFSEQPHKTGFSQVAAARVFKKLMNRLGHQKFYLQGGDWGAIIVSNLARMYPESVYAMHSNMMVAVPANVKGAFLTVVGSFFPSLFFSHPDFHTFNYFKNLKHLIIESGYMHIQGTKPDTVGTALNDSPLGLAAYILEKFSTWTNYGYKDLPDGGLTKKFTMDELLTIVTMYWTQGNIVSSQRFYKEFFLDPAIRALGRQYLEVPSACVQFTNELFVQEPPEILSTMNNITSFARIPNGGHFAAFEEPKALAQHVFAFVRGVLTN